MALLRSSVSGETGSVVMPGETCGGRRRFQNTAARERLQVWCSRAIEVVNFANSKSGGNARHVACTMPRSLIPPHGDFRRRGSVGGEAPHGNIEIAIVIEVSQRER